MTPHRFDIRVYYEDTDLAGVVYYANYLRFIERARTELLRELGVDQVALRQAEGVVFMVRRCEIRYRAPARFDDLVTVETRIRKLGRVSLDLDQMVLRNSEPLAEAVVNIAMVGPDGRPARPSEALRSLLAQAAL